MWYLIINNRFAKVALLSLALGLFFVFGTARYIRQWSGDIGGLRGQTASNLQLRRDLERELARYNAGFNQKVELIKSVRPSASELVSFLDQVDSLREKLSFENWEVKNVSETIGGSRVVSSPSQTYRATFDAPGNKLIKFLKSLELFPFYIEILDFDSQANNEKDMLTQAKINVTFRIFTK